MRLRTGVRLACAVLALAIAATIAGWRTSPQAQTGNAPTLLVVVVVDQMRADYLARYGSKWSDGFRRLLDQGTVYEQASYPYLNTVTCAGHATLSTGAWPRTHGIIMNQWFRRDEQKARPCTADSQVRSVPYDAAPESEGHSAEQLRVPTLAEHLRARWPDSRAVTVSLKARSAIMLAGKGATAVTWLGDDGWQTSTAFAKRPVEYVARRLAAAPFDRDRQKSWTPFRAPGAYEGVDDGVGERAPAGWSAQFPHPLSGGAFHERWKTSPYSDEYLGALAASLVDDFALGKRQAVDFLGVSFSATDYVGHAFGPESLEVQDTLDRLDKTIGALMRSLDAKVGRGRYVLGLSADHGVAPIPEARQAVGLSGGRVPMAAVAGAIERALTAVLGAGPHVVHAEYSEVYLSEATRTRATPAAIAAALAAARAVPGVLTAEWTSALGADTDTDSPAVRAMRSGYDRERSGDITVAPAPFWLFVPGQRATGGAGTTHGSANPYDQRVPFILFGSPFASRHSREPVTPADMAPTLAAAVGVQITGVEGRALLEAGSSGAR